MKYAWTARRRAEAHASASKISAGAPAPAGRKKFYNAFYGIAHVIVPIVLTRIFNPVGLDIDRNFHKMIH
jgi:hypothetical protein